MKIIRKRFDLPTLNIAKDTVKEEFELDKNTIRVIGILLVSDREEMAYYRGTIGMSLSGEEIVPEGYHAKLLQSGLGVAPKDRYLPMLFSPGNGMFKVSFTDHVHPVQLFSPHNVSIYLELEIEGERNEG